MLGHNARRNIPVFVIVLRVETAVIAMDRLSDTNGTSQGVTRITDAGNINRARL